MFFFFLIIFIIKGIITQKKSTICVFAIHILRLSGETIQTDDQRSPFISLL